MSYPIEHIEGIGPATATKLREAGINTTAALLSVCGNPSGRKAIGEQTAVSTKNLLKWTNMADLMRISGVGRQYAELLEAAGVDTVKELRNRNAENLAVKLKEVFESSNITRTFPGPARVQAWVHEAKSLQPAISH